MASTTTQPRRTGAADAAPELRLWSDRIVGPALATAGVLVLLVIAGMVGFVFHSAWPSFHANGLRWFGSGGDANLQMKSIFDSKPPHFDYTLRAWPLLYGTALSSGGAVILGLVLSTFAAIFVVEFAPPRVAGIVEPVVRLLAGVPSVIYGLIGILVLVPFVGNHLISTSRKESVFYVVQLSGASLLVLSNR